MLNKFLISNRDAIIARMQSKATPAEILKVVDEERNNEIPVFLDQIGAALLLAKAGGAVDHEEIGKRASLHAHGLLRRGLSFAEVVHDYRTACEVITDLAIQQKAPISGEDFRSLNACLDDAIAETVAQHSREREHAIRDQGTERLGVLAHELRNLLSTALLAFDIIQNGHVAPGGSTGTVLGRSLLGLRDLIDRSLADVRLDAGIQRLERIPVAEFVEEIEISAQIQSQARSIHMTVEPVDSQLTVQGDRQILAGTMANLLQNAFKFTRKEGRVSLTVRAANERLLFEVQDECGGLPPGKSEGLFLPFEQCGADRSGIGLGLAIGMKAAKAHGGELSVRDLPGRGCVFTLALPLEPTA